MPTSPPPTAATGSKCKRTATSSCPKKESSSGPPTPHAIAARSPPCKGTATSSSTSDAGRSGARGRAGTPGATTTCPCRPTGTSCSSRRRVGPSGRRTRRARPSGPRRPYGGPRSAEASQALPSALSLRRASVLSPRISESCHDLRRRPIRQQWLGTPTSGSVAGHGDLWCSLECTPACQAGGRGFKSRQVRSRDPLRQAVQPTFAGLRSLQK